MVQLIRDGKGREKNHEEGMGNEKKQVQKEKMNNEKKKTGSQGRNE